MHRMKQKSSFLAGVAVAAGVLASSTFMSFAADPGTACSGAAGSVNQSHNHTYMDAEPSAGVDCGENSKQCNQNPCSYCDGSNSYNFCVQIPPEPYAEKNCQELATQCGTCMQNGTCDGETSRCSGGEARDENDDEVPDICWVKTAGAV